MSSRRRAHDAVTDQRASYDPVSYGPGPDSLIDPNSDYSAVSPGPGDAGEVTIGPVPRRAWARWRPAARSEQRHGALQRLGLFPRTLAARLVTGVVVLVIVVVALSGTLTYEALSSFLVGRLDQQLDSTATSNGSLSRLLEPTATAPGFRGPTQVWLGVLDSSGAVLPLPVGSSVNQMRIPAAATPSLLNRSSNEPADLSTTDGVSLRVEVRHITFSGGGSGVVVIGLSTEDTSRTLSRLLLLVIVVGASAVLLALIATTVGVRLSLGPLRRVTATARTVTAELSPEGAGLDRRVPLAPADAGTEVGQLTESVNTLLEAVETQFAARLESEHRMRQFLADASHELRTPLTSIRGYAELARMRRDHGSAPDPDAESATMDRIESEGTRMSRLVEDLLTLARGDQGQGVAWTQVEVGELLLDAAAGARAAYPDRQIDVVVPEGLYVLGDHDQLLRVVRNLVTNACVHTAPGGPIRVSAMRAQDWVLLQVADAGPGLPPDQAGRVFERFWRADSSRARRSGGSGLGLAIVASLVQAHGGSIRFDSDVATGSTVSVYLPAR